MQQQPEHMLSADDVAKIMLSWPTCLLALLLPTFPFPTLYARGRQGHKFAPMLLKS